MALTYHQQKFINRLTIGLSTMGAGFTMRDILYNFRQSFKSFRRFFKAVWNFRSFDYTSTLSVLEVCLKMQLDSFQAESAFKEVDETRLPKEAQLQRCLQLLDNIMKDDYSERCGYDHNFEVFFVPIEGSTCSTMESTATKEQKKHNRKVREKANELQEAEWNELMDILRSNLRNYWT
ncbi:MAG: hypothetical protein GXY94_12715 [Bacteroidales bacterium]|jgi:hypothetical protein|nr:hypothetical protein [Bacteroidales bacterium]